MNINYQPVSCSFVDHIEDYATRNAHGGIKYVSKGRREVIYDIPKTWIVEDGQEFLVTTIYNKRIRLDRIIELIDIPGPAHRSYFTSCF